MFAVTLILRLYARMPNTTTFRSTLRGMLQYGQDI